MSSFTDRLYATWLSANGCHQSRRGYGAQPHASEAKRREGYPTGQTVPPETQTPARPARPWRVKGAPSRNGSPRANDAASRPEKPAAGLPAASPFLPEAEKSSAKSIT